MHLHPLNYENNFKVFVFDFLVVESLVTLLPTSNSKPSPPPSPSGFLLAYLNWRTVLLLQNLPLVFS